MKSTIRKRCGADPVLPSSPAPLELRELWLGRLLSFSPCVKSEKLTQNLNYFSFFFSLFFDSPLISMRSCKIRQGSHPSVLLTFSNNIYCCESVKTIKPDDIYAKGS